LTEANFPQFPVESLIFLATMPRENPKRNLPFKLQTVVRPSG
jgi:hypothetical protein